MREFIRITKALADPNRVRALLALRHRELCVCQISDLFRLAPSTISKHLSILRNAGLIESRKEERWVYYRLAGEETTVAVREAIDWVRKLLARTLAAEEDNRKLKKILKMDPTKLCQRQSRR